MEETTSRKIAQNCQDMPSRKNPKKESKMPEVKENLKETVEEAKEKASEAVEDVKEKASEVVEEVKRSASNVVKAVKEEDTGARTMIVILALGCAAGSGFLAGKGGGAAPAALLGGEQAPQPTHCVNILPISENISGMAIVCACAGLCYKKNKKK